MQKLYCYVDESGQDTHGELFVVSIAIAEGEREALIKQIEQIEATSKKGQRKWMKARNTQRLDYIQAILNISGLKSKLNYAAYHQTTEYLPRTILATAQAITRQAQGNYKAVIFVDGLRKSQTRWFGAELRHLHIRTEKVKGVRKEESDALMRLADALAGFVRAGLSGQEDFAKLLVKARKDGIVREV